MTKRKPFGDILDLIIIDSTKAPAFIDKRRKEHKEAFMVVGLLLTQLLYLIKDDFLTDKEVYKIIIEWCEIWLKFETIDSPLYYSCMDYVDKRIKYYMYLAEETEEYEVLANFNKFMQLRDKDLYGE